MDKWLSGSLRPNNYDDFMHEFIKNTSTLSDHMLVEKCKISNYDGSKDVPLLKWSGAPIEIIYVDCGRTFEINEAWYKLFSGFFIPNITLIIMQDYRTHLEVPVKWYNQTKHFTDSKGKKLQLLHELKNGCIATFIYRGEDV